MEIGYVSKICILGCPAPLCGERLTPKILCLVMVGYKAKFSSCNYNSWSMEIPGMKNWDTESAPIGYGWV